MLVARENNVPLILCDGKKKDGDGEIVNCDIELPIGLTFYTSADLSTFSGLDQGERKVMLCRESLARVLTKLWTGQTIQDVLAEEIQPLAE